MPPFPKIPEPDPVLVALVKDVADYRARLEALERSRDLLIRGGRAFEPRIFGNTAVEIVGRKAPEIFDARPRGFWRRIAVFIRRGLARLV